MMNKKFAIFNCIDEKEANTILDWFVKNFDEKDIERVADVLAFNVKQSMATINDFYIACFKIKEINPEFHDLEIVEDLKEIANRGICSAKACEDMAKIIKYLEL